MLFCGTLENMARRSSGLSGFIEHEQLLSNVIESEDASKCYSFPSALIISEVCDIEQLFPFSSGLQTSSPVRPCDYVPHLQSLRTTDQIFPLAWASMRAVSFFPKFASYCTHFCIYRNVIQLPK